MPIAEEMSGLNSTGILAIMLLLIIVGSIVYFMRKLHFNRNDVLKAIGKSLVYTLILELVLVLPLALFLAAAIRCEFGKCPGQLEVLTSFFIYSAPILLTLGLMYYIFIQVYKSKKK